MREYEASTVAPRALRPISVDSPIQSHWLSRVLRGSGRGRIRVILAALVVAGLSLKIGQSIGHGILSGLSDKMIPFRLYDGAEIRRVPLMWILFGVALVFVFLSLWALQAARPNAVILSMLLVLFLTPEYVLSAYLFPFPLGTIRVTDALWWCWLILAVLYTMRRTAGWRSLVNLPFGLVMLFLGYSLVALMYAFMRFGIGRGGFSIILLFVVPFVIAVLLLRSQRDVRWFERALFIVAFYPIANALFALVASAQRIGWTKLAGDPMHMLAMVMPLLVTNALYRKTYRVNPYLLCAGAVLPLLLGLQRSFFVICLLSLLMLMLLVNSNQRRTLLKWLAISSIIIAPLIVGAITFASPGKSTGFWDTFWLRWQGSSAQFNPDPYGTWRGQEFLILKEALERNPMFGSGLGSGHQIYLVPEFSSGRSETLSAAYFHWAIFWIPVNLGLPGMFIFLAIFGVTAGRGYQALRVAGDDDTRRLLTGALSMLLNIVFLTCVVGIIPHSRYTPFFGLALGYTVATVRLFGPKGV